MWSAELPEGYETRKCLHRVAPLLRGLGLDIGCEKDKINKDAVGIGLSQKADIKLDLAANDALRIFGGDYFNYVFAAGQLGNFVETEAVLREWWRVLRYDGVLIIYEPDADYYPRIGTPGCSGRRKKNLYWEDAWRILEKFGNAEIVSSARFNDGNEYSWQLVVKKTYSVLSKPFEVLDGKPDYGHFCLPRKKKTDKEALVIRFGALGDMCWITPVLKELKNEGYYVAVNCTERGAQVLKECRWIDEFIVLQNSDVIDYFQLEDFWQKLGETFDRVINLTKSVEGALIKVEDSDEFYWPHEKRHAECNINFQDRTMELAGYPEKKGCVPEIHFTDMEESLARSFRAYWEGKFVILWGLAGSAFHKVYPWAEDVAQAFTELHKDVLVITVGDTDCRKLEWQSPQTMNQSGNWTVRQSFIAAKYADLVIGPDTGLLNAASCYETPKIIFMSANSKENLTKYWKNCTELSAEDCECYPCHRLIYASRALCPKGSYSGIAAKCMENIKLEAILKVMEKEYKKWQVKQLDKYNKKRWTAFTVVDDEFTYRLAKRVKNSFEHFHPEIPFFVYDARDEERLLGSVRVPTMVNPNFAIRPRFVSKLLNDYDGVIHLDADTVVTGRLDEFLKGDFDVAGSLNIGDEKDRFCNAGVCAVTNRKFTDEWTEAVYDRRCPPTNQFAFNDLANKYNFKIVDEKDVYYNERSRKYWKELHRVNEHLECNGRVVKVLHWAGGISRMEEKLSSKDFSDDVRVFLNEVTGTTDFSDFQGVEVSKW